MKRTAFIAAVWLVSVAVPAPASAQSKDDPAIGSWKLNVAKSTFTPGPPIKGDTRTGVRFAAKFDGKPYPQIGRFAPTVTLITYELVDKRTLKYTQFDTHGKVNSTNTRTVSADGKTMTIEQRTTNEKGQPVVNVELFERQ